MLSKGDWHSEYLKDTYAATGKVLEVSSWTESLATNNLSPTNNNTASTSLLAKGMETYQELNSTTDDLSEGLPSPTLPFSDLKVEGTEKFSCTGFSVYYIFQCISGFTSFIYYYSYFKDIKPYFNF